MRRGLLVVVAAFGVTLAVIVGLRLEQAGLAVVVGVVCGILAGLPVSGALLYLYWREREARRQAEERRGRWEERPAAAPPVFILNAGRGAEMLPGGFPTVEARPRQFVIVGEEELQQKE